jgi:shikimate kinase
MLIFLVGYMGAGKSTGGQRLARRLRFPFYDTDRMLEKRAACSIAEIFAQQGEAAFRVMERDVIRGLIDADRAADRDADQHADHNAVVSTGGGAPCHFDTMDRMRAAGVTIYLQLPVEKLVERLKPSRKPSSRPLLSGVSRGALPALIAEHLAEREPFYTRASMIVDGQTFESERVESVARMIEALS